MKKEKPKEPETEYQKLMYFIDQMDTFLAPRVMDALKLQIGKTLNEERQQFKETLVSPKLLALQSELENFETSMRIWGGSAGGVRWLRHMRPLFRKVMEIYGPQIESKKI